MGVSDRVVSEEVPTPTLSIIQLTKQPAKGKTQVTAGYHLWSFQETGKVAPGQIQLVQVPFLLGFLLGANTEDLLSGGEVLLQGHSLETGGIAPRTQRVDW